VAIAVYVRADDSAEYEELLRTIAATMVASENGEVILLGNGLEQWMAGRALAEAGDYEAAEAEYRDAERLLSIYPSPGLFFDLGAAYTEMGEVDEALANLERAVSEEDYNESVRLIALPAWRARVTAFIVGRPELLARWAAGGNSYPALAAILPTPTFTPTPTATPRPTETPAVAVAPSRTPLPTETAEPTLTPTPPATATPEGPPTLVVQRNANLRAGPGLEYDLVIQAPAGTEMEIIGRTQSGDWLNVRYLNRLVWISFLFVLVDGGIDQIEVVATVPPRPTATQQPTAPPATTATAGPSSGGGSGGSSAATPTPPPPTEPPATEPSPTDAPRATPTP
jgi:uncharacterized protein YraI